MSDNNTKLKTAGAVIGAVALVGGAVAFAAPATMGGTTALASAVEQAGATQMSDVARVSNVQGTFAFDQGTVTPNPLIASVFNRAASSLCASLPDYDDAVLDGAIDVGGNVTNHFTATVDEMAQDAASTFVLACACASNLAGGGAMANAEVSGVSLADVATRAGAR